MTGTPELTPLDIVIGTAAKALRESRAISQEKMAEILECSVPMLSQLENGKRTWKTKWIYAVASYFNVHPSELFGGSVLSDEDRKTVEIIKALRATDDKLKSSPKKKSK